MSSQRRTAINSLLGNLSTLQSTDVYGTAMPRPSTNAQAPGAASHLASVRTRRPTNLPMDTSAWNVPYGDAEPMSVRGRRPRGMHGPRSHSPLPAGAYDFQQLSRQINPFDADFQGGQHFTPERAQVSYHGRPKGRQDSLQLTPQLQNPNMHTSQQLGRQNDLNRHQQAANMASGDYLDYRGSSRRRHVQVPNTYTAPDLVPEYVQHGHHSTHTGNGSRRQNVDHSLPMGEAMMDRVPGQSTRQSPSYDNFHPEPGFVHHGHVTDPSHPHIESPYMQAAGTELYQGPAPSQLGSVNTDTGSQPYQEEAPAYGKEKRGPKTEEICQKNGQLFHRTGPRDEWGKSLIDLMDDGGTDDGPEPAVKHSAIFNDLLQWAKGSSTYRKFPYLHHFAIVS